ncbi:Transcription initiation factor [Mycena kentingensis (nom. inval.)]|nr:Transcription initiation factor [Mycena kentingensis (nom. inval.)]
MSTAGPNGGRHSPVPPLAPLEFLQQQQHRRGSITDPSLHATTPRPAPNPAFFRPDKAEPRPASPYVFGSANHGEPSQLRKLLRSPSPDNPPPSSRVRSGEPMNIDSLPHPLRSYPPEFDYSMRRHSIAVGQDRHSRSPSLLSAPPHGIKRKMSADPAGFATLREEGDAQLSGPGVSSGNAMEVDAEAPAPKRRGSVVDAQRIAQLSLSDRRDSVDSRPPHWWMNDRRDSTSSMFSNVSSVGGGYSSSGFSNGDSPHRPPPGISTFSWPAADQPPPPHKEVDPSSIPVPPIPFGADRRMSAADARSPSRVRQRSRPPSSRGKHSPEASQSGPSSGQEEPTPSPTNSGKLSKEMGATPYSRSPELRVSHKLAERKRRKEMKDLFDELRDELPAERGMKASKWEILSKAIDFVTQLKQSNQDMSQEIDTLRRELDSARSGSSYSAPPHSAYAPQARTPQPPGSAPISRPGSQNSFSNGANGKHA